MGTRSFVLDTLRAFSLFMAATSAAHASLPMERHMSIQVDVQKDADLARLPPIRIDTIVASVPLDDRIDADNTFDRPFTEALRQGMEWYLGQRGVRVVTEGESLRLLGTINAYEGDKGWGEWGVKLTLAVRLMDGTREVIADSLMSGLMYADPDDVRDELKDKYKSHGLYLRYFREVLLTRVGVDLSEKLIALFIAKFDGQSVEPNADTASSSVGDGELLIDSSQPNSEVLLDGILIGTTPLSNLRLPAGRHLIEIRKKGFKSWKRETLILVGGPTRLVAELEPERGN